MEVEIREYRESDLAAMKEIWNEVVEEGIAFPQEQPLDEQSAKEFFASQSFCAVAENDEKVVGLYILHPNNVGRCGHIAQRKLCRVLLLPRASRGGKACAPQH